MDAETARLIGGQFDGDRFELDFSPEPEYLAVFRCPDCKELHHGPPEVVDKYTTDLLGRPALYRLLRVEGAEAVYVQGDLPTGPWLPDDTDVDEAVRRERVLEPA